MGWWGVSKNDIELLQGDGPYDIMGNALDAIILEYQRDWERQPTLQELLLMLQSVLGAQMEKYVEGGDTIELTGIVAKTKTRPKRKRYAVGDYFAIPLPEKRFVYGRILSGVYATDYGMLVGIYQIVTKKLLVPEQLDDSHFMFPPFFCSPSAWESGRWPIIGKRPLDSQKYDELEFKMGRDVLGWQILAKGKIRNVSAEEAKPLEPVILYPAFAVEVRILKVIDAPEDKP